MSAVEAKPKAKLLLLRLSARLRGPLILALMALALVIVGVQMDLSPAIDGALGLAARTGAVIAVGWALTSLVDEMIARRMRALDLNQADNLEARKAATRLDVLRRVCTMVGLGATLAAALTAIPWARQIGLSLFASAGIAGIALGIAARPVLANLIAGLQIAFTQPIRVDDVVIIEGEWGRIEEIELFYVVVRIWDERRLVVPLAHFIEKPFQNWTRVSADLIGSVFWRVDYRMPVSAMRGELERICRRAPQWDGRVVNLQVTDADDRTIEVRALVSAANSSHAWDLRCLVREEMLAWLQREHPQALPRLRAETLAEA